MENIKFYLENNYLFSKEVSKSIKEIKNRNILKKIEISNVNELFKLYNIKKYIEIKRLYTYIEAETGCDLKDIKGHINKEIICFFSRNKKDFINKYDEVEKEYQQDFFELFEKFKIYIEVSNDKFKKFLSKNNVYIFDILELKHTVNFFNKIIKENLISDINNAEIIIDGSINKLKLEFPKSLTMEDKQNLIEQYVDSQGVNYNYLKDLETLPGNNILRISNKLKLKVKRKREELEENFFKEPKDIKISVGYIPNKYKSKEVKESEDKIEKEFSEDWIKGNLDYPTLLNNFIYLFDFVNNKMELNLDSKKEEEGSLERAISTKRKHLYNRSISFDFKEMISNIEVASYYQILRKFGVKIENIIEWFFKDYLLEEFSIKNFIVKLPSENLSFFEKCRVILPEIDRILKQYNCLVEENEIDQELIQISSSGGIKEKIKSLNENKYVYSSSDWFKKSSYLLFSDQSGIFYFPKLSEKYNNFFNLVTYEKVKKKDFKRYQMNGIQWLIDNKFISEDSEGIFKFQNLNRIYIVGNLYKNEFMNFWNYSKETREDLLYLESKKLVDFESSLFSKNEQEYLNFNLNKSKFTNGYDIRNKYLHGSEENQKENYQNDYYIILKIIIIIIIKINDDLCIRDKNSSKKEEIKWIL